MGAKIIRLMPVDKVSPEALSDVALVAACARGDEAALALLFRRHREQVYRFLGRLLGRAHPELEDCLQQVFLTAWRRSPDFEDRAPVAAWLMGIAANTARTATRSDRRRLRALASLAEQPPRATASPEDRVCRRQMVERALEALQHLPYDLRVAYVLCDLEDLPRAEAAKALALKNGTLRRRLHDARRRLRACLEGEEDRR